jgi:RPA family protein
MSDQTSAKRSEILTPVAGLSVWELTPDMKQTLSDLSKEVFGNSRAWEKLIKKGELIQDTENKKAKRWVPLTLEEVATRMFIIKEQRDLEAKMASESEKQGESNAQSNQEVGSSAGDDGTASSTVESGSAD